jgi:hypothetical protein
MPVFTVCIRVKGDLFGSFVFEDHAQADAWMNSEFLSLVNEYGELSAERSSLPGLRLDSGEFEEVANGYCLEEDDEILCCICTLLQTPEGYQDE